ncbi:MAG TPA: 50S ribosomal protein L11 methyltransferase, partial [Caulobacteraceae bacterium]|nr:50S ribosomal protein L11 methyltransferase [Caulobacteraceae bacterium]
MAEVRLYTGHPGSGLARLTTEDAEAEPPYWAYPWGGGLVLARHILDHPETVTDLRVIDLGCGGGLVAIAAAKAGAASVLAVDIDPFAIAAA